MNHPRLSGSWLAALGAVALLLPSPVPAQPPPQPADDTAALREQVENLQRALQAMQQRLDAIEASRGSDQGPEPSLPEASSQAPAAPAPARPAADSGDGGAATKPGSLLTPQVAENWAALRDGMSPDQVKALLGAPGREFRLGGQTVWYYYYTGVGGGSVVFSRGNGNLLDWQRPPFHAWW